MAVVRAAIVGGDQLRRTAALLREAGRTDLLRGVSKAVKDEAKPTLDDVRRSARQVQVVGVRTTSPVKFVHPARAKHLRDRMAAATVVEVRAGERETRVSFHVDSRRMGGAKQIPRYIDLGSRVRWRHPIMGNRSRWAQSKGQPWFFPPIKDHLPKFRERISAVLDEIVTKIEGA